MIYSTYRLGAAFANGGTTCNVYEGIEMILSIQLKRILTITNFLGHVVQLIVSSVYKLTIFKIVD